MDNQDIVEQSSRNICLAVRVSLSSTFRNVCPLCRMGTVLTDRDALDCAVFGAC